MCMLQKSIYGLKQASRSWNLKFDHSIKSFGFVQSPDEPCVYKCSGNVIVFLVLYVDDILLIENDVGTLSLVKLWLSGQFDMKDLGEASPHSWDQAHARSPEKNVGVISGIIYR